MRLFRSIIGNAVSPRFVGAVSLRCVSSVVEPSSLDARLKAIEQELVGLRGFVRAVEARDPAMAAEIAASLPDTSNEPAVGSGLDSGMLEELYDFYGLQPIELWPLREFCNISTVDELIHLAAHVHREYLVRLAHRARSLRQAPLGLAQMPSVRQLRSCYEISFAEMRRVGSLETREDLVAFDSTVRRIILRHKNTADLLSDGLYEFASREQLLAERKLMDTSQMKVYREVQSFFDTFCDTRVRLRFMLGHHAALSARLLSDHLPEGVNFQEATPFFGLDPSSFDGHICQKTDARKVVLSAIRASRDSEVEDKSLIPPVVLTINQAGVARYTYDGVDDPSHGTPFLYSSVPHVLYGSVVAVVGEAIRANVIRKLRFGVECEPIEVEVTQGEGLSDVTVSIRDSAGGMPLPILKTSLTCVASCRAYLEEQQLCKKGSESFNRNGCGWSHCPIRMSYAVVANRVFGGEVNISSLEGVGTTRNVFVSTDRKRLEETLI